MFPFNEVYPTTFSGLQCVVAGKMLFGDVLTKSHRRLIDMHIYTRTHTCYANMTIQRTKRRNIYRDQQLYRDQLVLQIPSRMYFRHSNPFTTNAADLSQPNIPELSFTCKPICISWLQFVLGLEIQIKRSFYFSLYIGLFRKSLSIQFVGEWVGCVLRHNNPWMLFNANHVKAYILNIYYL